MHDRLHDFPQPAPALVPEHEYVHDDDDNARAPEHPKTPPPAMSMGERWAQWILGMALAALVAYFTTTSAIQAQLSEIRSTEAAHFQEVLRTMGDLRSDLRDLRYHQNGQP